MHAEFVVKSCFNSPGLGVLVSGEIMDGNIEEGAQGKTPAGKLVTIVRMDIQGVKVKTARIKEKVNIVLKGVAISDVNPGMNINFF
ncbi:MAG: hypothetical protein M0R20_05230 [Candidatus Omnitrophica bacterium]|jgi:GTPase|nr:hypothetical protein [Candidatus Omnitrophota bacterium]